MAVSIQTDATLAAGNPEILFEGNYYFAGTGRSYDIAPGGQWFLVIKEGGGSDETATRTSIIVACPSRDLQRGRGAEGPRPHGSLTRPDPPPQLWRSGEHVPRFWAPTATGTAQEHATTREADLVSVAGKATEEPLEHESTPSGAG